MFITVATLLVTFLTDGFVQRSNDPFTILWARTLTDSDCVDAAHALAAYDLNRAATPIRLRFWFATGEERVTLAYLLVDIGSANTESLNVVDSTLRSKRKGELDFNIFRGLLAHTISAKSQRLDAFVPSLTRYIRTCEPEDGGIEAGLLVMTAKPNEEMLRDILKLLQRSTGDAQERMWNRAHVASALAIIGPSAKEAVPRLEEMLKNDPEYAAGSAAAALLQIAPGHEGATDYLSRVCAGKDDRARRTARMWLGFEHVKSEVMLSFLPKIIENPNAAEYEIAHACQVLAKLGEKGRPAIGTLKPLLRDKRPRVRVSAAYALCAIDPRDAELPATELGNALQSEDREQRKLAAEFCAQLKVPPKSLLPELRKTLHDESADVIKNAAKTILRIDPNDAEVLSVALKLFREGVPRKPDDRFDRTENAKRFAVDLLAQLGPRAKIARPELVAKLRTATDTELRDVALAIKAMDTDASIPQKTPEKR